MASASAAETIGTEVVILFTVTAASMAPAKTTAGLSRSNSSARAGSRSGWHGEAECLGSLEIDDQLKSGRLLHRQIYRLLALQYAINVARCPLHQARYVGAVRHETSLVDEVAPAIQHRQALPGGQLHDRR